MIELVELYHGASLRDEDEINKINLELVTSHDCLKSTQNALQESKIHIEKLYEKLPRLHSRSYIANNHSHMVDCIHGQKEGPHVVGVHLVHSNLHMLDDD